MTLGQCLSLVTLCILVFLTSSNPWYYFEYDATNSDENDINTEFYIDKIDTDDYDYEYIYDVEDKMNNHKLLVNLTTVLSLVILVIGMFRISSVDNAKKACLVVVILSFLNGIVFLSFPWTLEEEYDWFSDRGIEGSKISFSGTDFEDGKWYVWGPLNAWYLSTIIIPIYGLLLRGSMDNWSSSVKSKRASVYNQKRYGPNDSGFDNASITIPRTPLLPNPQTSSSGSNDLASQRSHEPPSFEHLDNNIIWDIPFRKDRKISFSRPDLKEKYEAVLGLTGGKTVYSIEGLITVSGCSEILFGTRNSDGRMVVVKRPYGYKKKEEKGKGGKVNTYTSAKKQLENEYHFLSTIMKHNKTNFPELLDCFNQKIGRRTDLYMVTKYFSPSLKMYVEFHGGKKGGLEFERALNLFLEIAAAVEEIHENIGYVWADLKSENILMQEDTPILIDFGTSTLPVSGKGRVKIDSGGWSAPETIEGAPVFESDIYSLGKLFAYLLTEIQPKAKQKFEVFRAQVSHELKKRNIDERVAEIIIKCSSERIADRYGSVIELVDDLQDFWKKLRVRCLGCNCVLGIHAKFCKACGKKKARESKRERRQQRQKHTV